MLTGIAEIYPVQKAVISVGADATAAVVAATTGKRIYVISYVMLSTAAGTLTWKSNTTAISGAFPVAANGGVGASHNPHGNFWTEAGEALNLTTATATAYGHLTYCLV